MVDRAVRRWVGMLGSGAYTVTVAKVDSAAGSASLPIRQPYIFAFNVG